MIYTYVCDIHSIFEVNLPISKHTNKHKCNHCDSICPQVILETPMVTFKGGDWASKKPKVITPGAEWKGKGEGYC